MGASTLSTRTTIAFVALFCLEVACGDDEQPPPSRPLTQLFTSTWSSDLVEVRDCRRSVDHDLHSIRVLVDPPSRTPYTGRVEPFAEGAVVLKPEYSDEAC